jgi:hypothetical protein
MGDDIATSRSTKSIPVSPDGTFRISGVVPGRYILRVAGPGCPPTNAECRAAVSTRWNRSAGRASQKR